MYSDIQPHRIHENLYFIGSSKVSVHLLDTEDGLVLIDTGYPEMLEQILCSMDVLGFSPKNICALFHTHGHIDHIGCTQRLKALSGAKTYISRMDNAIVDGTLDLSWSRELGYGPLSPTFDCDVLVEDGDVFTFGKTSLRCLLTPGHTDGVLSFFITLPDGTVAAMHGGGGMNTMNREFLTAYGRPFTCRDNFRAGLHRLAAEKVDYVLGDHPEQTGVTEKLKKLQNGESVQDNTEWQQFLLMLEKRLDTMIAEEARSAQRVLNTDTEESS